MVEEVLVMECFSAQHIACGKELLARVEGAGIEVVAAYWIRDLTAEVSSWKLEIVTPEVDQKGPLKLYRKIHELVSSPSRMSCGLDTDMIAILGVSYSSYERLRTAVESQRELSGVRLSQFVVGDTFADLYIYKFPRSDRNGHKLSH